MQCNFVVQRGATVSIAILTSSTQSRDTSVVTQLWRKRMTLSILTTTKMGSIPKARNVVIRLRSGQSITADVLCPTGWLIVSSIDDSSRHTKSVEMVAKSELVLEAEKGRSWRYELASEPWSGVC